MSVRCSVQNSTCEIGILNHAHIREICIAECLASNDVLAYMGVLGVADCAVLLRLVVLYCAVVQLQPLPSGVLQIFEYNGSAIVAMAGKECFAIGSDLRFGVQFQTLATDYKKVYKVGPGCRSMRHRSKALN